MHDQLSPAPSGKPVPAWSAARCPESKKEPGVGFSVFGIALPFAALAFELLTHGCAQEFFDPIPSWWHVALVALVPITNLLILLKLTRPWVKVGRWLPVAASISVGVSAVYSLAFLPMLPLSVVGIMFAGLGFLPLAPMFALLHGARGWARLRETTPGIKFAPGFIAALIMLGVPLVRDYATVRLLDRAISGEEESRIEAVQKLRQVGDRSLLLKRAYGVSPRFPFGVGKTFGFADSEAAQVIYYRVTGRAFDSEPLPVGVGWGRPTRGSFSFDVNLGGNEVGNQVSGLSMQASNLESRIEPVGLTSYTEWTLVFKNSALIPNEARAQIELPPGGVVSRVTLWIDGEPKEAAFGGRSQVRAAYQEVAVVQRRDPILVTTSGLDRVLMQCFPVPANGGTMKVRLGITAPLQIHEGKRAGMVLPRFLETNFEQGHFFSHELVMRGAVQFEKGEGEFRGKYNADELGKAREIRMTLPEGVRESLTDVPATPGFVIRQKAREELLPRPKRVIYVIDGSDEMRHYQGGLREVFTAAGEKPDAAFFAGDRLERWDCSTSFADWIVGRDYAGGCDNVPALREAWTEATREPGSAIVWIHGAQPTEIESVESLLQRAEVDKNRPVIYDLPFSAALNPISAKLADAVTWKRPPTLSSPLRNLMDVLHDFTGTRKVWMVERELVAGSEADASLPKADQHVARIWGREEVQRLNAAGKSKEAMELAVKLQLVTPVSGAVVLERKEQYDRHGLEPVDSATVPMIPEPASMVLLISGAALLAGRRRRIARE